MPALENRMLEIETQSGRLLELLQQSITAVFTLQEQIDQLEGRLRAQSLLTTAVLQLASRSDPPGFQRILAMLEMTELDLTRAKEDEAARRELSEVLAILRAFNDAAPIQKDGLERQ